MSENAALFMLCKGQHQPEGNINDVALPLMYPSIMKKGPWAAHTQTGGGGRIFVTSLHFTTKKRPCLHYPNPQQDTAH